MSDDAAFNRFWSEYPKKRSKGDAFKAWNQVAAKRPPIEKIIKSLIVLKASDDWRRDGGQYIPYPATWLRDWGWDDVPEVDLSGVVNGKMWWETVTGVDGKARELGIREEEFPSRAHFRNAVFKAAGHNVQQIQDAYEERPRRMLGVVAKPVAGG